ncbi:glycosyltransferase [Streptosporangium sp. NPDC000396]|uniref:glycosyltransferase n=1 Tax=Streptosporangium sp. NPDC000396 TaxID=3366185 RepID=UPI0036C384A0
MSAPGGRLATAAADAVVISADSDARTANVFYWQRTIRWLQPVTAYLLEHGSEEIRLAAANLSGAPGDVRAYRNLRAVLTEAYARQPAILDGLVQAWRVAAPHVRIGYHLGARYDHIAAATKEPYRRSHATAAAAEGDQPPSGTNETAPRVAVIIPFQDRGEPGERAARLLSCLRALRDQTAARDAYRVVVVETDTEPRWQAAVSALADEYLFAANPRAFNKSWTVNLGVRHARCQPEVLCVLDADVLVDADFVARNLTRFDADGLGAFLPYRDMLYLDTAATATAVQRRCEGGELNVDWNLLRGFLVRRPPGGCVWLRRPVFDAINGWDERHEGWGGEDMDVLLRLHLATAVHYFDDRMCHLRHQQSAKLVDGDIVNRHIPRLSWVPDGPIGQPDRFADANGART